MTQKAIDAASIKGEIEFFMDKCFQASFGYLASLVAFLAVSRADYVSRLADSVHLPARGLISIVVLLLNVFYFTVIGSCLFAILKRGYFLLALDNDSVEAEWERFTRNRQPHSAHPMPHHAWDIDNYYMLPILGLLAVISFGALAGGLTSGGLWTKLLVIGVFVLNVIPAVVFWFLGKLNHDSRQLAARSNA